MKKDINDPCLNCRYVKRLDDSTTDCINPNMSRADIAEAVVNTFFGEKCRGFQAIRKPRKTMKVYNPFLDCDVSL